VTVAIDPRWADDETGELVPRTPSVALPVPDELVEWAVRILERMAVMDEVAHWKELGRKGLGGRPESFPLDALLVAMVIAGHTTQPMHAKSFRDILFVQVSPAMRSQLGIPDPPGRLDLKAWNATYRTVRTRLHGLLDMMDPSDLPKNRKLPDEEFQRVSELNRAGRSDEERTVAFDRLTWFCNRILEASIQELPREYRRRWKGSVAVDATNVPAFSRMPKQAVGQQWGNISKIVRHGSDPDAGIYVRDRDHRDEGGENVASKKAWSAYEASLIVSGPDDPEDALRAPALVVAMAPFHTPGAAPGKNAITALTDLVGRGHPVSWLAGDRAYSNSKPENYQLPARSLGYKLVYDYRVDQLGIQASAEGFIQVEGSWYCPSMPKVLIRAEADHRAGLIDDATRLTRLEGRKPFKARRNGLADDEGHQRLMCPAAGSSPTARCPLKKRSMRSGRAVPVRITPSRDVKANPPRACVQESVTVTPEMGAKFDQELDYGLGQWHSLYSTLRNGIEGMNGYVKDGAHGALASSTRRRIRGRAAQSVLGAFILFAENVRKIASFVAAEEAIEAGVMRRLPRRRSTRSFRDWLPGATLPVRPDDPPPI